MASHKSFAAAGLLALITPASAAVYNYNNGGQDWSVTRAATATVPAQTGYPLCATGMAQSPVNLANEFVTFDSPALGPLAINYSPTFSWTANYIEIDSILTFTSPSGTATGVDGVTVDGTFIPLNQFHFHSPSEHTINGVHYPLEMHLVHKLFNASAPTQLLKAAVIGVMFTYDPMDAPGTFASNFQPVLTQMINTNTATVAVNQTSFPASNFDFMSEVFGPMAAGSQAYYRYNGSLTTPGCTEGILWHVMAEPLTISRAQLLAFTNVLAIVQGGMGRGGDNRLIQPLNGRSVLASFPSPADVRCKNRWYKSNKNGKWVYGCLTKEAQQGRPQTPMRG